MTWLRSVLNRDTRHAGHRTAEEMAWWREQPDPKLSYREFTTGIPDRSQP